MNTYPHRKAKPHAPPLDGMKIVRIDPRTVIQVKASVPDDVARERFLKRTALGAKPPTQYLESLKETENLIRNAPKEVPVGDLDELAKIVDDSVLPEEE